MHAYIHTYIYTYIHTYITFPCEIVLSDSGILYTYFAPRCMCKCKKEIILADGGNVRLWVDGTSTDKRKERVRGRRVPLYYSYPLIKIEDS